MSDALALEGREQLFNTRAALLKRFNASTDQAERDTIADKVDAINRRLDQLDLADLLSAASAVGDAASDLEAVVASAKTRPLDSSFDDILASFRNLESLRRRMHAVDALPRTPEAAAPAPSAPVPSAPVPSAPAGTLVKSTRFEELRDEYAKLFETGKIDPPRQGNVDYYLRHIGLGKGSYADVAQRFGIPWFFIGIIHGMECGFDFNAHLHNGDPLTKKTVRVPKGRPKIGSPPFTWKASCEDAIQLEELDKVADWSVPHMLYRFEKYNGFGYRRMGLPSPYLWSFSNHYTKGKYVADGKFDPEAVSQQCGAAVILKEGKAKGLF